MSWYRPRGLIQFDQYTIDKIMEAAKERSRRLQELAQ